MNDGREAGQSLPERALFTAPEPHSDVHAARQQDRRLSAALLAAAIPHTAEAGEVVNGARTRMSRKPAALARELLRNFPKGKGRRGTRRRKKKGVEEAQLEA